MVTATRTDQDVQKIPAAVQVITAKQITAGGAASVQEVLRTEYGYYYRSPYACGQRAEFAGDEHESDPGISNGRRVANEESNSAENSHVLDRIETV